MKKITCPERSRWANISQIIIIVVLTILPLLGALAPTSAQAEAINITSISSNFVYPSGSSNAKLEIKWQTNIASYSRIYFGTDPNNFSSISTIGGNPTTSQQTAFATPKKETLYYYKIEAFVGNNKTASFVRSFKTPKFDEQAGALPIQSNISVTGVTGTTAVITWSTDQKTVGTVKYGTNLTALTKTAKSSSQTEHQVVLSKLNFNTVYYYQVTSKNENDDVSLKYENSFQTLTTKAGDNATVNIYDLKPNTINDSAVTPNGLTITFRTDKPASSSLTIQNINGKNTKKYNNGGFKVFQHEYKITELDANTTYRADITVTDVNGKKKILDNITFATSALKPIISDVQVDQQVSSHLIFSQASRLIKSPERSTVYAVLDPNSNKTLMTANSGWYARYYDHSINHGDFNNPNRTFSYSSPSEVDWYNNKYLLKTTVDTNLKFGKGWFPLDSYNKEGFDHNYFFAAHWTGYVNITTAGEYAFELKSDDDSWVLIDNKVVTNNSGGHSYKGSEGKYNLTAGQHKIDVFYAERGAKGAGMYFGFKDKNLVITPFPAGQSKSVYRGTRVQLHPIMNPGAFLAYGYSWNNIEIVSQKEINSYALTSLVRTPDDPAVYILNQAQRVKIAIPNEQIFKAYGFNWNDIVVINGEDLKAFNNTYLAKAPDSKTVYLIENNTKRAFTSAAAFYQMGFNFNQVITLNSAHLQAIPLSGSITTNNVQLTVIK